MKKQSKKDRAAEALRQSDITAQIVERDDIEYGEHTELPNGENVARLKAGMLLSSKGSVAVGETEEYVRGDRNPALENPKLREVVMFDDLNNGK